MANENQNLTPLNKDKKVENYKQELYQLRKDGILKIQALKDEIYTVKNNKLLEKEEKLKIILKNKQEIEKARTIAKENQEKIAIIEKEACQYVKMQGKKIEAYTNQSENEKIKNAHHRHFEKIEEIHQQYLHKLEEINERFKNKNTREDFAEKQLEIADLKNWRKSSQYDEKNRYHQEIQKAKDGKYQIYLQRRNTIRQLKNGHQNLLEIQEYKWKSYLFHFNTKTFLLNNALYLSIFLIYIICIIVAPLKGKGNLLTPDNILQILEQSSTRIFYALGVAGLILLAGTDLSIGRMIALGSVITSVVLHDGVNIIQFFKLPPMDFSNIPMFLRVILALFFSILLCTFFSTIAGFFTARFKMHPFITTLSTQLLIYGLLYFSTEGTPTGGVQSSIKDVIGGRIAIGSIFFPKIILYAILAIIVVWFIWNKTRFGKNMYAVGGNAEAASVSGINVFWTTLGVFIMAGILYGCGSFLEAFRANSSAGTGQGWELDAIAACVVGGISFNGGVGKIKGAVLGVLIFTGLTYCLSFLAIDTNLQFIFKGIIIMAAVALDSAKYLKKK